MLNDKEFGQLLDNIFPVKPNEDYIDFSIRMSKQMGENRDNFKWDNPLPKGIIKTDAINYKGLLAIASDLKVLRKFKKSLKENGYSETTKSS